MSAIKTLFFHYIAPPVCAYCKVFLSDRTVLCKSCVQMIRPLVSVTISITKKNSMPVFCVGEYTNPLKKMILAKGWSDYIASNELGQLIVAMTPIAHMDFDFVVPIPLHWTRYTWRGYNQASEMAKTIANQLHIPCIELIKRVRATPLQSSVAPTERETNVKNVFDIALSDIQQFKHKRILLVDDLMTTGSTLHSAARVIHYHLKPSFLCSIVAARVRQK